jgi:hypothetical protein
MCAKATVKKPKLNPNGIQVEANNNARLMPVIASGLIMVKFADIKTPFV